MSDESSVQHCPPFPPAKDIKNDNDGDCDDENEITEFIKYLEKRKKNNESAKRSRDKRRLNDLMLESRLRQVVYENSLLKSKLELLTTIPLTPGCFLDDPLSPTSPTMPFLGSVGPFAFPQTEPPTGTFPGDPADGQGSQGSGSLLLPIVSVFPPVASLFCHDNAPVNAKQYLRTKLLERRLKKERYDPNDCDKITTTDVVSRQLSKGQKTSTTKNKTKKMSSYVDPKLQQISLLENENDKLKEVMTHLCQEIGWFQNFFL